MSTVPQFRPLAAGDLAAVAALARIVWQATYPGIISQEQIDTMLAARYCDAALREYLTAADRWFDVAVVEGSIAGFCACEIYKGEYKLDKIYVDPAQQRSGLGGSLISRAEARGRKLGRDTLILAVNKKNAKAIAAYHKHGFTVRESVCINLGNGFFMDDYIMQKQL